MSVFFFLLLLPIVTNSDHGVKIQGITLRLKNRCIVYSIFTGARQKFNVLSSTTRQNMRYWQE